MTKRPLLKPHQTIAEIESCARTANDEVARSQWQIVLLVAAGWTLRRVATTVNRSERWVEQVVKRYNEKGPSAIGDQRRRNPGARPLLGEVDLAALKRALAEPPSGGGRWTSAKVAAWIGERIGRPVPVQRGWVYLRQLQRVEDEQE